MQFEDSLKKVLEEVQVYTIYLTSKPNITNFEEKLESKLSTFNERAPMFRYSQKKLMFLKSAVVFHDDTAILTLLSKDSKSINELASNLQEIAEVDVRLAKIDLTLMR